MLYMKSIMDRDHQLQLNSHHDQYDYHYLSKKELKKEPKQISFNLTVPMDPWYVSTHFFLILYLFVSR